MKKKKNDLKIIIPRSTTPINPVIRPHSTRITRKNPINQLPGQPATRKQYKTGGERRKVEQIVRKERKKFQILK